MPATDQPDWASIPDRPGVILITGEGEWSISASPTDPDEFRLRFGARKPPYDIAFTQEVGRFAGVYEAKVMAETW